MHKCHAIKANGSLEIKLSPLSTQTYIFMVLMLYLSAQGIGEVVDVEATSKRK
jgi:hypothetical protein